MLKYSVVVALFIVTGCGKGLFTQEVKERLTSQDSAAIENLQFYINNNIVLERTSTTDKAAVAGGKVVLEGGVYTEHVFIRLGTRALCENVTNRRLKVLFGVNQWLYFDKTLGNDSSYRLYVDDSGKQPTTVLSGSVFKVIAGQDCQLLVSKKYSRKNTMQSTKIKGLRLKDKK